MICQRTTERIHKVLARMGLGSRRKIEEWIREGRIELNGEIAKIGAQVGVGDHINVDGYSVPVRFENTQQRLILYNKREGEVCTRTDPMSRPTIFDHLPRLNEGRWVALGRLDINTTGLILFTTDGDLANFLLHPSSQVEREYAVRVYGKVTEEALENLRNGVVFTDGYAKFSKITDGGGEGQNHWYFCVICEGKNREVRKMWETQNVQVSRLIRVRFGHILLPRDLPQGEFIELDFSELLRLQNQVGVKLKKGVGLYGRSKVHIEKDSLNSAKNRGGYLRRRRR